MIGILVQMVITNLLILRIVVNIEVLFKFIHLFSQSYNETEERKGKLCP